MTPFKPLSGLQDIPVRRADSEIFQQRGGAVKALTPKARLFCDRQVGELRECKAQGSSKKVSVLASLFPTLKITPLPPGRQGELFNYKYQGRSRLRPTPSPRALCQAKPKISLLCGGVGKPQPNNETRERCHGALGAHGACSARAGRQGGVLFTSSAPSERGLGSSLGPSQ